MANFETRVEGLTGLTAGTDFTTAELTEYLKDGVIDVTNRCIALNPHDAKEFQDVTAAQTSQGANLNGAKILSVVRESGVANQWEDCRYITPGKQYNVTDTSSLDYASKFHPVYTLLEDGKINVYPAPDVSPKSYKVYYVNNAPQNASGGALAYNSSDLKAFPDDKVYLVPLYAAIKSLQNALSAKDSLLPDKPMFVPPVLETINSMSLPSAPVIPTLSDNSVSLPTTVPTFDEPNVAPNFADAENWITTEEDSEMVAARVQVIGSELQKYNTDIQKATQKMNKENIEYQAQLQKAIQDAQLSSQDDSQKLQKYSSEIQSYQAQVQKEVQRWTNEEYNNKLNEWSKEFDGKLSEFNANIQSYGAQVAKVTAEYGWMEKRMLKLQQEYDSAFALMAPKQQQPQKARG